MKRKDFTALKNKEIKDYAEDGPEKRNLRPKKLSLVWFPVRRKI